MTGVAAGNNISTYHFGDYVFDVKRRELVFGADSDAAQTSKAARFSSAESLIFCYLLDHPDEVCDKDLLLDIGWQGRPISPNSLNVAIANIRRHFVQTPQILDIKSTPKKGYSLHLNCKVIAGYGYQEPENVVTDAYPISDEIIATSSHLTSPETASSSGDKVVAPTTAEATSLMQRIKFAMLRRLGRPMLAKTLTYINIALVLLLLSVASYLHFEWLHVSCGEGASGLVCRMEAKSEVPVTKPDSLVLISGHQVRIFSYQELEQTP
ncbi:winged helix-turn-helix domain-containing protein [Aeromonas jandaei]|uniref:winged helix-turn-helix domain-containing protein n=1 Tax=Aeromonas jandaei TaxID=650 RepID=UPI00111714FD|nr:winged helix-turn-helix domain-containing protein [Aeromonas jandaei]TNI02411.1 transcriptional regulator [Aeromonas jandaei]